MNLMKVRGVKEGREENEVRLSTIIKECQMARQLSEAEEAEKEMLFQKHNSASSCVWTYPMLQALDNGVKGGKWFSLKDKICRVKTILFGYGAVSKNKGSCGIDNETIQMFDKNYKANTESLSRKLEAGEYQPLPVKRVYIDKPGTSEKRPLGIPTVRQRIVENAFKFALEPIFENEFLECSYGFRPEIGAKDALREVTRNLVKGYSVVIDADIKGYFDTINHKLLMSFVEEQIADQWVLNYLKRFLGNKIMDDHKEWTPVKGSPQGSVLSPLLSNIYLHRLDKRMVSEGFKIIRYADDFVVMCKTKSEAEKGLALIHEVMDYLKLTLHPDKTKVVETSEEEGFEFLGYRFTLRGRTPRKKSVSSLKNKIREKTRRSQGKSIKKVIEDLNPTLRGWFNYFKHIKDSKYLFENLDKFIRRRLRSILGKFNKKKGSHRMSDNMRWRNIYFHNRGLFSLQKAHEEGVALARGKL
jgi:RNA-directed DNA polymerase